MKLTQGDHAPDFELPDAEGTVWRLSDLKGQKAIVYFYPADDTSGCTKEACDFRDSHDRFVESGYKIFGISPQGSTSKKRFISKYSLNFPLLIDDGMRVAEAYGTIKERISPTGKKKKSTLRSTFVIAEDGRIERAMYGVSARGHVDDLLGLTI